MMIMQSSYSFKIMFFFVFIIITTTILAGATPSSKNVECPFEHTYHFGDGYTDIGNSIHVRTNSETYNPAANFPYGTTYPGWPTGRWSDGLIDFDFAAVDLGVSNITPYLSMNASASYGAIVFSVARSPVLDVKFFESRGVKIPPYAVPLRGQLNWFKKYLKSICSTPKDRADRLGKSLLLMGDIEANDIGYPLAQGKSIEEVKTYVPFVVRAIIQATRELIKMGAVQIAIPGNAPLGCYPYILTALASNKSADYDDLGCLKSVNDLILMKNELLQQAIEKLSLEFPNVSVKFGPMYDGVMKYISDTSKGPNGELTLKACCGIGGKYNFDSERFCGSPGVTVCPYPNRHIFWDGIHLTHHAFHIIETIVMEIAIPLLGCTTQLSVSM